MSSGKSWGSASITSVTIEASRSADEHEDDEVPVLEPEYGDLLDSQWLERGTDALDPEDDLVDIGLTIDMTDSEDRDEAHSMDLDVGTLLTSLPAGDLEALDSGEPADREAVDGALHELLLPDEREARRREDDEEVGNDERFPAFDGISAPRSPAHLDDDAEGPGEG